MLNRSSFICHKNLLACILACLIAVSALFFLVPPPQQTEIAWQEYSLPHIQRDMDQGKVILISAISSKDLLILFYEARYSRDPAMLQFLRTHPVSCYRIDLASLSEEQFQAWQGYYDSLSPLGVVLLVQTPENDAVMETIEVDGDQLSPQHLISRLEKLLVRRNTQGGAGV
ncbi:hypothetical protein F1728_17425 [Gimesia benthica]|uniref:Uncharacterized protein n=1 Tax=Gimesia benthica TaxID=2608982 RepID=A0A6I6AFJ7_9PLAN|nr:hypothetical protein [Gimesia benthica]QGQ24362.1 hypothetical protein F1728_17425 [Gimesia benthica]